MMRWRSGFLAIFLFCAGSIGFALYHQYYNWLMPCLYCVYERIAVTVLGLLALLAALWVPKNRVGVIVMCDLLFTTAVVGVAIAARHVMMQYGPADPSVSCVSNLPFPVNLNDPFWPSWLAALIRPVGDCAVIDFMLLDISMPVWLLVSFLGMAIAVLVLGRWRWQQVPWGSLRK